MISLSSDVNFQRSMAVPATKEASTSTATVDVKFGDKFWTVHKVVGEETFKNANEAIKKDSAYFIENSSSSSMKSKYCSQVVRGINNSQYALPLVRIDGKTKTTVKFDHQCQIIDQKSFEHQLQTSHPALIKLAREGVETLARQFSLHNQPMDISRVSILRNYISRKGISGGRWHRDGGDYSLVMLMNDDSVIKKNAPYYTGGGLQTAKIKTGSIFSFFADEGTDEEHEYPLNGGGFAFTNNQGHLVHRSADCKYVPVETGEHLATPLEKRLLLVVMSHPKPK